MSSLRAKASRNDFTRPPLSFVFRQAHHGNYPDVANGSWRTPMRGFTSYVVAGILVVLALDFIAPPVGLGLAVASGPAVDQTQTVLRSHKGDRLRGRAAGGKTPSKFP